jgi:hypothetical protein
MFKPKRLTDMGKGALYAYKAATLHYYHFFICGNCESFETYEIHNEWSVERDRPKRCSVCGEEVEWSPIPDYTDPESKHCPSCGAHYYREDQKYCVSCSPKTALVKVERKPTALL